MPFFMARKEVFAWLKSGAKTIDVRKGPPRKGDTAIFRSGANKLEFSIINRETGKLAEVITQENFRFIIPIARSQKEAIDYLGCIYGAIEGVYTAYHLIPRTKPT